MGLTKPNSKIVMDDRPRHENPNRNPVSGAEIESRNCSVSSNACVYPTRWSGVYLSKFSESD